MCLLTDRQKADVFAEHPTSVFQPFPSKLSVKEEETINNHLNSPHQMALPMRKILINEVKNIILYEISPKKTTSYDLITGKTCYKYFPERSQSNNTNL
jgi:hypothetical protein